MTEVRGDTTVGKRQKRWHAKTRSGCLTCRKRRVKCDEQRPCCKNCTRIFTTCEGKGYGALQASLPVEPSSQRLDLGGSRPGLVSNFITFDGVNFHQQVINEAATIPGLAADAPKQFKWTGFEADHALVPHSPLSRILSATRSDPFDTGIVKQATAEDHRLLDHAISNQWSLFARSRRNTDLALVKQDLMSYAANDKAAYYSLLYSGACHHAFWRDDSTDRQRQEAYRLNLKTQAIRHIIDAINTSHGNATDEMLIAMFQIGSIASGDVVRREILGKVQSRKTQGKWTDTEFYAALESCPEQEQVLAKEICRRGGPLTIRPGPLRNAIILYDAFNAFKLLRKPMLPMTAPLNSFIAMRTWQWDDEALTLGTILGRGFQNVYSTMPPSAEVQGLIAVCGSIRSLIMDFDYYRRCDNANPASHAPEPSVMVWIRNMTIHELMNLPDYSEAIIYSGDQSMLSYELTRMTCLMFAQNWFFPIRSTKINLARTLVNKVEPMLQLATTPHCIASLSAGLPQFYEWAVVLALMLAYEDLDSTGNTRCMQKILPYVKGTTMINSDVTWPKLTRDFSELFWSPWSECDITGREAWQYVRLQLVSKFDSNYPV